MDAPLEGPNGLDVSMRGQVLLRAKFAMCVCEGAFALKYVCRGAFALHCGKITMRFGFNNTVQFPPDCGAIAPKASVNFIEIPCGRVCASH